MKHRYLKRKAIVCLLPTLAASAAIMASSPWENVRDAAKLIGSTSTLEVDRSCDAPVSPDRLYAPLKIAGPDITIFGVLASSKSYAPPCIASFSAYNDFNYQQLVQPANSGDYSMSYTSGGFFTTDGNYCALDTKNIVTYDPENWEAGKISSVALNLGETGYPRTATYDPTTGLIYGCFDDYVGFGSDKPYVFASIDPSTGVVTRIKNLPGGTKGKSYGMAVDQNGTLYIILAYDTQDSINFYPALYKADKTTGELTYLGNTNVALQGDYYGAAIDLKSGKMYWTVDHSYNSGKLYEIDTNTGKCTEILNMPNGEQFCSIAIPYVLTAPSAPALLTDLFVKFNDAQGNGTVTFTIPTTTYAETPLEGEISYTVKHGEKTLASGSARPDDAVSASIKVDTSGEIKLVVSLTGGSEKATSDNEIKVFSGNDTPDAPTNVRLNAQGNSITINWDATATGLHGGYVDSEDMTYKVVLQPEGIVVAEATKNTEVQYSTEFEHPTSIYAEITPTCAGLKGMTATSERAIAGPAFQSPWFEDFTDSNSMHLFTVLDVAGDNATWNRIEYNGENYVQCEYSQNNPKDDWLFTPAIHLESGVQYTLSFKASSLMVNAFPESMEVKMGKGTTPENMTFTVLEKEQINNVLSWEWYDYSLLIEVDEAGDYNFGFHAVTEADKFKLALDDIRLEGAPFDAPSAVTEISTVAAPWGVHNATLKFRTPSVTNNGNELTSLINAEIYLNNRLYATIESPAVNSNKTLSLETTEGLNTIDIYTTNEAGRSIAARTTVYTGADSPGVPKNFHGSISGNSVHLTWDAPDGANGGMLDTDNLNFMIGRYVDGGDIEVLSTELGNVYEYVDECEFDDQTTITYVLGAANELGTSASAISNCVVIGGEPYALPFVESFTSGFTSYDIWQVQTVNANGKGVWRMWNPEIDTNVTPYDSDSGAICFEPFKADDIVRLFSGAIDLSRGRHPVLEFWYRGNGSEGQTLAVEGCDENQNWFRISEITLSANSNEWTQVKIPLNRFNYLSRFQLAFVGEAANTSRIYLDKISIREVYTNDLSIELKSRLNHYYGKTEKLSATVTNCGENPSGPYSVEFYSDNTLLASLDMPSLEVDETAVAEIDHAIDLGYPDNSELSAIVKPNADEYLDNNTASSLTRNHLPLYPAPQSLSAEGNPSMLSLNWSSPEKWEKPKPAQVTDDFESYEPFLIDEIGDWTCIDQDGEAGTFGLIGFHFPHREEAKSWQLFNLWALGIEMADDEVTWRPSSGHQFLVSFADKDRKTDDWLISPLLSGQAQTISFMTRSLYTFMYEEESFEVYASKTGKDLNDFELIYSGIAPGEWTESRIDLPEGTRYFAIKCVSEGYKFAMGLDDITYIPGIDMPENIELEGYNLYKNRSKVNDVIISDLTTTCKAQTSDSFHVTAVYKTGESRFSNEYAVSGYGAIDGIEADLNGALVHVTGNNIIIENNDGRSINIATIDGVTLFRSTGTESRTTYTAEPGIYIVTVGDKTVKVVVK